MRKIIICITIFSLMIILTWNVAKNNTWNEARKKYNPMISANYANIIYAFSQNKQNDLLDASLNIIGTQIIYIKNDSSIQMNSYSYLCPVLNNSFKQLILENLNKKEKEYLIHKKEYMDSNMTIDFKKEKTDFKYGYKKLISFCQFSESV